MSANARICGAAFAMVAIAILGAACTVAWATAHGAPAYWRMPFHLICHGIESRAFVVFGAPMPICARCTGFYVGVLLGIGLHFVGFARRGRPFDPALAVVAALPLAIDGTAQLVHLWSTPNLPRALTGIVAGAGFLVWAMSQLATASSALGASPALEAVRSNVAVPRHES